MLSIIAAAMMGAAPSALPAEPDAPSASSLLLAQQDRGFIDFGKRDFGRSDSYVQEEGKQGEMSSRWLIAAGAGGALLAGGVTSWVLALNTERQIRAGDPSLTSVQQVNAAVDRGRLYERLGWVGMGLGLAGVGAGVALYVIDSKAATAAVTVTPTGGGGALVFVGRWP